MTEGATWVGRQASAPAMKNGVLQHLGSWQVQHILARGGFSTVYMARGASGNAVIKMGTSPVKLPRKLLHEDTLQELAAELGKSFAFQVFKTELDLYQTLTLACIPKIYEAGLIKIDSPDHFHTYMVLQPLGRDLYRASKTCCCLQAATACKEPCLLHDDSLFFKVARSMLLAVKSLHASGHVHRDIKPANFCLPHPSDPDTAASPPHTTAVDECDEAYLIDLGLSKPLPAPGEEDRSDQFVGTPDYASCRALEGFRQSARDDIESLGYALLEMYLGQGELPWDLTRIQTESSPSETKYLSASKWTPRALAQMGSMKRQRLLELQVLRAVGGPSQQPEPQAQETGGALAPPRQLLEALELVGNPSLEPLQLQELPALEVVRGPASPRQLQDLQVLKALGLLQELPTLEEVGGPASPGQLRDVHVLGAVDPSRKPQKTPAPQAGEAATAEAAAVKAGVADAHGASQAAAAAAAEAPDSKTGGAPILLGLQAAIPSEQLDATRTRPCEARVPTCKLRVSTTPAAPATKISAPACELEACPIPTAPMAGDFGAEPGSGTHTTSLASVVPGFLKKWIQHTLSPDEPLDYVYLESLLAMASVRPPANTSRQEQQQQQWWRRQQEQQQRQRLLDKQQWRVRQHQAEAGPQAEGSRVEDAQDATAGVGSGDLLPVAAAAAGKRKPSAAPPPVPPFSDLEGFAETGLPPSLCGVASNAGCCGAAVDCLGGSGSGGAAASNPQSDLGLPVGRVEGNGRGGNGDGNWHARCIGGKRCLSPGGSSGIGRGRFRGGGAGKGRVREGRGGENAAVASSSSCGTSSGGSAPAAGGSDGLLSALSEPGGGLRRLRGGRSAAEGRCASGGGGQEDELQFSEAGAAVSAAADLPPPPGAGRPGKRKWSPG